MSRALYSHGWALAALRGLANTPRLFSGAKEKIFSGFEFRRAGAGWGLGRVGASCGWNAARGGGEC